MSGWQKLWQDPEIAKTWTEMPPVKEVVMMADRLAAAGRRRVLDIGCGLGRHTLYLAARGFEVVGIDNAPAALDACRENLSKARLQATILAGEMGDLSFPAGSFDGALSTFVIHHGYRADIEHIIGSITRLLAPAGLFVWVTPTPRHYQCGRGEEVEPGTWVDPNHPEGTTPHHYSTEEEIRELLAAYDIESMRERDHGEGDKIRWHWFILARKCGEP